MAKENLNPLKGFVPKPTEKTKITIPETNIEQFFQNEKQINFVEKIENKKHKAVKRSTIYLTSNILAMEEEIKNIYDEIGGFSYNRTKAIENGVKLQLQKAQNLKKIIINNK